MLMYVLSKEANAVLTIFQLILDSAASFCPPTPQQNELPEGKPHLLVLSAKSAASLESNIEGLKGYLENKPALNDLSYTLATRREHLPHRAFTTVDADGSLSPFVTSRTSPSSIAFVFTGQGAQWPGMGRELILKVPEFKQDIESMDRVLQGLENPPSWTIEGMYYICQLSIVLTQNRGTHKRRESKSSP